MTQCVVLVECNCKLSLKLQVIYVILFSRMTLAVATNTVLSGQSSGLIQSDRYGQSSGLI